MDQEHSRVKKEPEDELAIVAFPQQQPEPERSVQEQQHVVPALSSEHPPPKNPTQVEINEKPVKKRRPSSKFKNVASHLAGKSTGSKHKHKKERLDGSISPIVSDSPTVVYAKQPRSSLGSTFLSFVKCLVNSNVSSGFWMGLPSKFCKEHLPPKDCIIIVEDEEGKSSEMKYLAYKKGFSGGWRSFSISHNLHEGDILVFQLVEPTKFKVYIVRKHDSAGVEGASGRLTTQNDADKVGTGAVTPIRVKKRARSLPLSAAQKRKRKSGAPRSASNTLRSTEQCENDSEEVPSEVFEGFKLSQQSLRFTDSFESFRIIVNGIPIDPELSEDTRIKYYELCLSQKAFLHEKFVTSSNFELLIGAINETVNISVAIKACNFSTSQDKFMTWGRTLEALEILGMSVGFLRARILHLVNIAYKSEYATKTRKYLAAKVREDEIRTLETRLLELKEASRESCANIEGLESKAKSYQLKFQEEVLAPW